MAALCEDQVLRSAIIHRLAFLGEDKDLMKIISLENTATRMTRIACYKRLSQVKGSHVP